MKLPQEVIQMFGYAIATGIGLSAMKAKDWWSKRFYRALPKQINRNAKVREVISEIRILTRSERAFIYQFKNGEFFVSGESSQRLVLTHMSIDRTISSDILPQAVEFTHSLASETLSILTKATLISAKAKQLPDAFLKMIFEQAGSDCVLMAMIKNPKNQLIGLIVLTNRHDEILQNVDFDFYCNLISGLLVND